MKIIRLVVVGLTLCAVGIYSHITYPYPTYNWKQKLTVTLLTPQGIVSGTSVVGVSWMKIIKFLPDMPGARYTVTGEATIVALPDGRHLFALVKGVEITALKALAVENMPARQPADITEYLPAASEISQHLGETKTLTPASYPILAAVGDPSYPADTMEIHAQNVSALGPGYELRSVDVSIVDEPITVGRIDQALGNEFFKAKGNQFKAVLREVGPFGKLPFAFQLRRDDFITQE
jgi:hypothetical protein